MCESQWRQLLTQLERGAKSRLQDDSKPIINYKKTQNYCTWDLATEVKEIFPTSGS